MARNGRVLLFLLVLAIAEGAGEDGTAEGADGGSFGGFTTFVVTDHGTEESAKNGASGCAAFGVVHGAGAAD